MALRINGTSSADAIPDFKSAVISDAILVSERAEGRIIDWEVPEEASMI